MNARFDGTHKIILVQRQTLAWEEMDHPRFRELSAPFCRMWGKADDFVFRLMQLWDRTFSIGYFEVRYRLKQIAQSNQQSLSDIECVTYQSYRNIPDGGQFYLFIDDDDWLAPDIGVRLSASELQYFNGLLWQVAAIGAPNAHVAVITSGSNSCMTNNYAISGRWLGGLNRLPEVIQHGAAVKTFEDLQNVGRLDQILSVTNKSPCSSVFLARGLRGEFEPAKLADLVNRYVVKMKEITPQQFAAISWATGYIAETLALFESVLDSQRTGALRTIDSTTDSTTER